MVRAGVLTAAVTGLGRHLLARQGRRPAPCFVEALAHLPEEGYMAFASAICPGVWHVRAVIRPHLSTSASDQ